MAANNKEEVTLKYKQLARQFVNLGNGGKSTTDVEIHDVQPQAETKRPFLTAGGVIIVLGSGNGYFFIRGTLPPHTQFHAFQVR
ncbi:MAG: hypothetical protein ACE5I2_16370 [Anaerolineae bacterium]